MRSPFLLLGLAIVGALDSRFAAGSKEGSASHGARPNVVLVVMDDHDFEHFGFLGNELAHTPTLDRLAEGGTVFPVTHASMSRCRASLASVLTGLWPHQHGIFFNDGEGELRAETPLPSLFRDAGYVTFLAGKFWEGDPTRMGFEGSFVSKQLGRTGQEPVFAFLEENARGDRPVFLWWSPMLPHVPHDPPQRFLDLIDPASIPIPDYFAGNHEKYRAAEHRALAMVAWFDDALNGLLSKLEAIDTGRETLVVAFPDNGAAIGLVSKGSPFEKGFRTPLLFSWPGHVPSGSSNPSLASLLDVYPTLLDFVGIEIPGHCEGVSLRPVIEQNGVLERSTLFGAVYPRKPPRDDPLPARNVYAFYARTARYKYVVYLRNLPRSNRIQEHYTVRAEFAPFLERERGDEELYDLRNDPHEQNDLSEEPEFERMIAEFRAGILDWWTSTGGGAIKLP